MSLTVSTWSYRPGEWLAIFGASTTLLLPASEKARAALLWDLVDGGADFDETLDQVLAPGLSVLPAFVLIGVGDGPTKVIVRGAGVRATLTTQDHESVELDGSTVTTWVERTLDGVAALSVVLGGAGTDGPDYLIDGGLVRVARVDLPPHVAAAVETPAVAQDPVDSVDEPVATPRSVEPDAEPDAGVIWPSPGLPSIPPPPAPPALPDLEPDLEPVVDPAADPATTPDEVPGDHDGHTSAGLATEAFAYPQPGIPGQPPAPAVTRSVARLLVSHGESVDVDRVVLIGRAPEARRLAAGEQPRLVAVPSPLHEISSTHLEVRPGAGADHGSAVVTDLGSTNGTVLVQPGLAPEDLKPGIAVQLLPGAIINLGDGVTIQVTQP